jgi:CRISPR-associated protein (TIGR03986 family)
MEADPMKILVRFLEPFRMIAWKERKDRVRANAAFMRGQAFARWHKDRKTGKGRPFITGTLLRSAMIRSAENLLALADGRLSDGTVCCPGKFVTEDQAERKKLRQLRQRATIVRSDGKDSACETGPGCPFCQILGRFDHARKGAKKQDGTFDIHFGNLNLPSSACFSDPEDIAMERVLNRVDFATGKAHDFFRVWEVDHLDFPEFAGEITLADAIGDPARELLRKSLWFTDRLCGALCVIRETDRAESDQKEVAAASKAVDSAAAAEEILDILNGQDPDRVRLIGDAICGLRAGREMVRRLPKNHEGKEAHYLWDLNRGERTIRKTLVSHSESIPDGLAWRAFCEKLGEALYQHSQEQTGGLSPKQRVLGDVEYQGKPQESPVSIQISSVPHFETVIRGVIRAETPFFFGLEYDEKKQSDLRCLIDKNGRYRLPRSAIRGALRRDLHFAAQTGCNAELGGRPCMCKVCHLLRNVSLMDARSETAPVPENRHRIRLNPFTGTVMEGALFSMESGPQGIEFPFEMRYRGNDKEVPDPLKNVLQWWRDGQAFLSGSGATGKGRFILDGLECWQFDLSNPETLSAFLENRGWRDGQTPPPENVLTDDLQCLQPEPENVRKPVWDEIAVEIETPGPFLNGDPVRALLEGEGADVVTFQKPRVSGKELISEFALKSESFRGMVRTALSRSQEDSEGRPLSTLQHDDCECLICRLFGSEHEAGKLRFEDLVFEGDPAPKTLDHVAIDRFTSGAADQRKFTDRPLCENKGQSLGLRGRFWIRRDIEEGERQALLTALSEIGKGFYTLGGKGGIGYGWIQSLKISGPGVELETRAPRPGGNGPDLGGKPQTQVEISPEPGKIYYPHYFLEPAQTVDREPLPAGHQGFDPDLLTGKIFCTLRTLSPLIIPDTSNSDFFGMQAEASDHKSYDFFKINGEYQIPGASLRGAVSSVFEAITNSCFRIFDESRRLSWRMPADPDFLGEFKPGRIRKSGDGLEMEEMEGWRFPFYDPQVADPDAFFRKDEQNVEPIRPTDADKVSLKLSPYNRENRTAQIEEVKFKIVKPNAERKPGASFTFLATLDGNAQDFTPGEVYSPGGGVGYLKVTGPNKVEKSNELQAGLPAVPAKENWADIRLGPPRIEGGKCLTPEYLCSDTDSGVTYTMNKRCERAFLKKKIKKGEAEPLFPITQKALARFETLLQEYKRNAEQQRTPEVFRTHLPELRDGILDPDDLAGELVYFRISQGKVEEMVPVVISRTVDDRLLTKRLPEKLRPCHGEWVEENGLDAIEKYPEKRLFLRNPEGLCPACRLFGTGAYKGRLQFGFARMAGEPHWLQEGGVGTTLPLLERPRPTWSIPGIENEFGVPGRKFFVHHYGWQKVQDGRHPLTNELIQPTPNNRTVRPVDRDNEFSFEVSFENLSPAELGLLLYTLELEGGLAHKLGMAKSMGFGSAEVEIQRILLRKGPGEVEAVDSSQKKSWIQSGKEQLEEWFEDSFENLPHIQNLKKLMFLPEEGRMVDVRVGYPPLEGNAQMGIPDYKRLKDGVSKERRRNFLTTPWHRIPLS